MDKTNSSHYAIHSPAELAWGLIAHISIQNKEHNEWALSSHKLILIFLSSFEILLWSILNLIFSELADKQNFLIVHKSQWWIKREMIGLNATTKSNKNMRGNGGVMLELKASCKITFCLKMIHSLNPI